MHCWPQIKFVNKLKSKKLLIVEGYKRESKRERKKQGQNLSISTYIKDVIKSEDLKVLKKSHYFSLTKKRSYVIFMIINSVFIIG